jgi:hypothetical protein
VSRVSLNLIFVGTNDWKLEGLAATRKISVSSSNLRASVEDKQEDADFRGDRVGIAMATSVRREGKARELCMVKGRGNAL